MEEEEEGEAGEEVSDVSGTGDDEEEAVIRRCFRRFEVPERDAAAAAAAGLRLANRGEK